MVIQSKLDDVNQVEVYGRVKSPGFYPILNDIFKRPFLTLLVVLMTLFYRKSIFDREIISFAQK